MKLVVDIQKLGHRGMGIARYRGKVILVPLTAPGDRVEVKITCSHRDYDEAELIRVINSSPLRREPPCPYFGHCGGCQLQHLHFHYQERLKEELFREMLIHQGEVDESRIEGILSPSNEFEYRSHIDLHIRWSGKPLLGFMTWRGKRIVPIDRCLLALPKIQNFLIETRKMLEKIKAVRVKKVTISGDNPGDNVTLVLWSSKTLSRKACKLLKEMTAEIPFLRGIYILNRRGKSPITLEEGKNSPSGVVYSVPAFREITLEAWPGVFSQVNPEANRSLISEVMNWAKQGKTERVLDLYAGMGNFTVPMSFQAQEIIAVDINPLAIENNKLNGLRYNRNNIQWLTLPAKAALRSFIESGEYFDLVIMDPPRSGVKGVLNEILRLKPERIIYVSCDMATLARDIRFFQKSGSYQVIIAKPLDMFPQTFHLESITLLQKV